jgi:hypothetical protein
VTLLSCFLSAIFVSAHSQNFIKRYLNNLVSDTLPPEKPKLLIYPTLGFAPETSGIPCCIFGIGRGSPADPVAQVNADHLRFNERVLRQLAPSFHFS